MDIKQYMTQLGQQARQASRELAKADSNKKNKALLTIADLLDASMSTLITENIKDLAAGKEKGLDEALLDRLALNEERIYVKLLH